MSSTMRTQIYLTREQRARLDELGARTGRGLAELIREAVDAYLEGVGPDARSALADTFGSLPDLEVPERAEWDRARTAR